MITKIIRTFLLTFIYLIPIHSTQSQTPNTNSINKIKVDSYNYFELLNSLNRSLIVYSDSGNLKMVKLLLESGANPNFVNEDGVTALMYATDNGYYSIARLLIESGADVNIKPWDGNTALFAAIRSNNDSIAELLINSKAIVNETNNKKVSPLHLAAGLGYPYMTSLLIQNGAKVNEFDKYGNTPLMAAIYSGASITTDILIESGANVNNADFNGNTPLMIATQFNDTLLIQKLISAGADTNAKNNKQINLLSVALENNSADAFKKLFELGVKNEISNKKNNYYQFATENGSYEIANYLNEKGLKTRLKPTISRINFYTGFSAMKKDFMIDLGGGIQESFSRLLINIGFKYRPNAKRVLVYKDFLFYQFWERRYSFYISIQHLLMLKRNPVKGDIGFIPGICGEYTWYNYRGFDKSYGPKLLPVPSIGLFYQRRFFTAIGKWEFVNYYKQINSSNRISIQLLFSIPTSKRYINKKIDWLD